MTATAGSEFGRDGARQRVEAHVVVEAPEPGPPELLQRATGLPKQRIKLAMTRGAVWLTRGRETRRLRRAGGGPGRLFGVA